MFEQGDRSPNATTKENDPPQLLPRDGVRDLIVKNAVPQLVPRDGTGNLVVTHVPPKLDSRSAPHKPASPNSTRGFASINGQHTSATINGTHELVSTSEILRSQSTPQRKRTASRTPTGRPRLKKKKREPMDYESRSEASSSAQSLAQKTRLDKGIKRKGVMHETGAGDALVNTESSHRDSTWVSECDVQQSATHEEPSADTPAPRRSTQRQRLSLSKLQGLEDTPKPSPNAPPKTRHASKELTCVLQDSASANAPAKIRVTAQEATHVRACERKPDSLQKQGSSDAPRQVRIRVQEAIRVHVNEARRGAPKEPESADVCPQIQNAPRELASLNEHQTRERASRDQAYIFAVQEVGHASDMSMGRTDASEVEHMVSQESSGASRESRKKHNLPLNVAHKKADCGDLGQNSRSGECVMASGFNGSGKVGTGEREPESATGAARRKGIVHGVENATVTRDRNTDARRQSADLNTGIGRGAVVSGWGDSNESTKRVTKSRSAAGRSVAASGQRGSECARQAATLSRTYDQRGKNDLFDKSTQVWVGGLPWISEHCLTYDIFANFDVQGAFIRRSNRDNYAFVYLNHPSEVTRATAELNNTIYRNRRILVRPTQDKHNAGLVNSNTARNRRKTTRDIESERLSNESFEPQSRCWIKPLPMTATRVCVRELFQQFGQVVYVKLCEKKHPREKYAFVQFGSALQCKEAKTSLNGALLFGNNVSVRHANTPREKLEFKLSMRKDGRRTFELETSEDDGPHRKALSAPHSLKSTHIRSYHSTLKDVRTHAPSSKRRGSRSSPKRPRSRGLRQRTIASDHRRSLPRWSSTSSRSCSSRSPSVSSSRRWSRARRHRSCQRALYSRRSASLSTPLRYPKGRSDHTSSFNASRHYIRGNEKSAQIFAAKRRSASSSPPMIKKRERVRQAPKNRTRGRGEYKEAKTLNKERREEESAARTGGDCTGARNYSALLLMKTHSDPNTSKPTLNELRSADIAEASTRDKRLSSARGAESPVLREWIRPSHWSRAESVSPVLSLDIYDNVSVSGWSLSNSDMLSYYCVSDRGDSSTKRADPCWHAGWKWRRSWSNSSSRTEQRGAEARGDVAPSARALVDMRA